ncbi:MAG: hypothetical protein L7U53_01845 [Candidatus Poseidoniaceae archaeon]|nr:hypothetical protein [Candidatus Poseidoniaceae archaeon]
MSKLWALFVMSLLFTPLAGCTSDDEEQTVIFPAFSAVADNDEIYDNTRMNGNPFIVIFSAEWCNNPCYTSMHSIWATESELPVLVMSTDPAENASGVTLAQWHDSANAYDDDGDDEGVSLSSYAFMKGFEAGEELGITAPGTVMFINSVGEVTQIHEGKLEDSSLISEYWQVASA